MYIQDTIYFTCINVEESRNLVQKFATCPWRINQKTKSRNGAKFTFYCIVSGLYFKLFVAGSICADLERN